MPGEIWEQCNTVEECYEFMLAYAAQGRSSDNDKPGAQIREFLRRAAQLSRPGRRMFQGCRRAGLEPAEKFQAFLAVLDRDAQNSLAAIDLVLAQPSSARN